METKFSLKNKGVMVTGGASGIGKSIATTFAKQGAQVYVLDFNQKDLNQLDEDSLKPVSYTHLTLPTKA